MKIRFAHADAIVSVYKTQNSLNNAFAKDELRFAAATADAGVSATGPEPIAAQVAKYESILNTQMAASELGIAPQVLVERLSAAPDLSSELGGLLVGAGSVQRDTFSGLYSRAFAQLTEFKQATGGPLPPVTNPATVPSSPSRPPAVSPTPPAELVRTLPEGWIDATPGGNCLADMANCTYRHVPTGIRVTKNFDLAVFSAAAQKCRDLNYGGLRGWQLPTLEILRQLFEARIRELASPAFINDFAMTNFGFRSSTIVPGFTEQVVSGLNLSSGIDELIGEENPWAYLCVRNF